jgi:hypothetical protein
MGTSDKPYKILAIRQLLKWKRKITSLNMENIDNGGAALTAYAKLQCGHDHQRT